MLDNQKSLKLSFNPACQYSDIIHTEHFGRVLDKPLLQKTQLLYLAISSRLG